MSGNTPGGSGGPADDHPFGRQRRRVLASLGLTGVAGLAGCGGGDGGDGSETTTTGGGDTSTATEETSTRATTTEAGPELVDQTWQVFVQPPTPTEAQYNPSNGNVFWTAGGHMMRFKHYQKSFVDGSFQPEIAKSWNYRAGVLDVEMFEDHYFASDNLDSRNPVNITADDWIRGTYDLKNYLFYPDDFELIVNTEKTGEYSYRVFFDDTYRQEYAMSQSLSQYEIDNHAFYENQGWLDRFDDASSTSKIDEIAAELQQKKYYSPHPFTSVPFRVESTTETSWILTLRDDEKEEFGLDSHPRWVSETNWDTCEIVVSGEAARARQAFIDGELPFAGSEMGGIQIVDADVPFDTETVQVPRGHATGAYVFNFNRAPTSNVHFRRAFAYVLNRERHRTRFMEGDEVLTGMLTAEREGRYLSEDMLDTLRNAPHDNYGYDESLLDRAEAEMRAGGFEKNSDGNWLYLEGDRAGEPMSFEIPTYTWQQRQANNATAFKNTMNQFGIDVSVTTVPSGDLWGRFGDGQFEIGLAYWGGGYPTATYTNTFGGTGALYGQKNFPEEWEGPAMGEFATPPGEGSVSTETYPIQSMISQLQVTTDDTLYKDLTDRLAWVTNAALPSVPIGFEPRTFSVNTDQWDWPLPFADNPFAWVTLPRRKLWQRGVVGAKPKE